MTQTAIDDIKAFWENQAARHGADLAATNPDFHAKELELRALANALDPKLDTLEAGCGNGYNLFRLAETLTGRLVGFDYSDGMIAHAEGARADHPSGSRIAFSVADIMGDLSGYGTFPQVFTDRCLINLPELDQQIAALENLVGLVQPGGKLVLVESTRQGQDSVNAMRAEIGLDPIPYHWHNNYLDIPEFLARVPNTLRHVRTEHFSSLYFVISRVFNAALTPAGQAPDYDAEINRIAAALPSIGDSGPLKLFEFERVS